MTIMIYNMTITLKVYNKMRRATDIMSHISSERRSIFKACIGAHSPAVELDNAIRFTLRSGPL